MMGDKISLPSSRKMDTNGDTLFPRISLHQKLSQSAAELNEIISVIYDNRIYIPLEITSEIILYTLTLVPGIYNFLGTMSSGWSDSGCSFNIVLDDHSCVIGGCLQEVYSFASGQQQSSSFEYEITHGTYDYMSGAIEFTKWYFPFNYQYKVTGKIVYKTGKKEVNVTIEDQEMKRDEDDGIVDEIWFVGDWHRCSYRTKGSLNMKLTNETVVLQHVIKPGKYTFIGSSSLRQSTFLKIEVEFMKLGIVEGMMHSSSIDEDTQMVHYDENAQSSCKIIDGEWHHFGKIVLVFDDDDKEMNGFFNGSYYIGEWNPSGSSHSNEDTCTVTAHQMRKKCETKTRGRIGHFRFSLMKDNDEETEVETTKGVSETNVSDEQSEDGNVLFRNASLDDDDDDDCNDAKVFRRRMYLMNRVRMEMYCSEMLVWMMMMMMIVTM
eukprot:451894_1